MIPAEHEGGSRNTLDFPREPGTYALLFQRPFSGSIQVGKLGYFEFPAGFYLYVGSALGSGGLAGRLHRHLAPTSKIHWHIDYLSQAATLIEIWYCTGLQRLEHLWAADFGQLPGTQVPAPGFGASDCRCESHLFYFSTQPEIEQFKQATRELARGGQSLDLVLINHANRLD